MFQLYERFYYQHYSQQIKIVVCVYNIYCTTVVYIIIRTIH